MHCRSQLWVEPLIFVHSPEVKPSQNAMGDDKLVSPIIQNDSALVKKPFAPHAIIS